MLSIKAVSNTTKVFVQRSAPLHPPMTD